MVSKGSQISRDQLEKRSSGEHKPVKGEKVNGEKMTNERKMNDECTCRKSPKWKKRKNIRLVGTVYIR